MRKRWYERVGALILVLAMIIAMTAGCGGQSGQQSSAESKPAESQAASSEAAKPAESAASEEAAPAEEQPYEGQMPISTDGETLTVFTHAGATASFPPPDNELVYYKWLQDQTGITIDWQISPNEQYDEVMKAKLASGVDLPDIINLNKFTNVPDLCTTGLLMPLDDLIDEYGYYLKQWFDDGHQLYRALWSQADGHIYTLSQFNSPTYNQVVPMYNKLWLEQLGMDIPETIDEFKELVYAMKGVDFNGNGKDDEIILTGSNHNNFNHISCWFGLEMCYGQDAFQVGDDGKTVTCDYIDPRYKEMLEFLHQMYEDGILDKEVFSNSYSTIYEKAAADRVGIVFCYASFLEKYSELTTYGVEHPGEQVFLCGVPLKTQDGEQYMIAKYTAGNDATGITKDCKDPVAAIKWLDYMYASPEAVTFRSFGREGEDYTIDADGKIKLAEDWDIYKLGGGQIPLAHIQAEESMRVTQADYVVEANDMYYKYLRPGIPRTAFNAEENEIYLRYQPDIVAYFKEMEARFVSGEESLDNWDAYVENMKKLHIDDLLAIYQSRYDRYLATN